MTHVTCRLTAENQDQLWNPILGNRVWATILATFEGGNENTLIYGVRCSKNSYYDTGACSIIQT